MDTKTYTYYYRYMKIEAFIDRLPFQQCRRQLQEWAKARNIPKSRSRKISYRFNDVDFYNFILWKSKNNRGLVFNGKISKTYAVSDGTEI